jgi:hypothetical protein
MRRQEYSKLAAEVAEPVHQMASRLVEQVIEAVYETNVRPLRMAMLSALHEVNYHNPEMAAHILREALKRSFSPTTRRCNRCRDGEKACVRGNPDTCSWPQAAA